MKNDKDGKDTFKMPLTTGGKNGKTKAVKEPPYRDLPADPVRPPHG